MPIAPAPTANTVILQTGNGSNLVSWPLIAGATSYSIQRGTDGVTFGTVVTSPTNSYLDSTVTIQNSYFYQVASVNGSGTSGYTASYPPSIVPCLPGQINLGYLRYMSQLRADKLNSTYLTTDEWNFNINQSANELYDILVNHYGDDYFFAPPLIIPLTGALSYTLPNGSNYLVSSVPAPALFKLNGADVNISGGSTGANAGWVPLSRANWINRDQFTTYPGQAGALNNVYQMSYRVMGQEIYFFPQNVNMSVRLWYVPILTQLLRDTDMMPFSISGWSEYVINDAAMKGMIKEESFEKWSALDKANERIRERINLTASNRDVGQPNTVSNIRAQCGDPGFSGWGTGFGGFGGY